MDILQLQNQIIDRYNVLVKKIQTSIWDFITKFSWTSSSSIFLNEKKTSKYDSTHFLVRQVCICFRSEFELPIWRNVFLYAHVVCVHLCISSCVPLSLLYTTASGGRSSIGIIIVSTPGDPLLLVRRERSINFRHP